MNALLDVQDLTVAYGADTVVDRVSFAIGPGECVALVGASGSGKTTIARVLTGMHDTSARVAGRAMFDGTDLVTADGSHWRALRGAGIGYVAQDPFAACDPLRQVQDHVAEAWRARGLRVDQTTILDRLSAVGIAEPGRQSRLAPHCWSGGMLQRASIAAASAHRPPLIVADEPTSALDTDRADGVLSTLRDSGSAILLISHDLGLVRRHADRIAVLDNGRIVETCAANRLDGAGHPATRALLRSQDVAVPNRRSPGHTLLSARDVTRSYGPDRPALHPVSVEIGKGAAVGVIGPSGAGKSTLLRLLAGIETPDSGAIDRHPDLSRPGAIMPIFQNASASLDARWPVWRSVTEPAAARRRLPRKVRRELAREMLARVGLDGIDPDARPQELSTGQCQRVAIARALSAEPLLLVADEPTSALDTLSRRRIADLLLEALEQGIGVIVATHDTWLSAVLGCTEVRVRAQGVGLTEPMRRP